MLTTNCSNYVADSIALADRRAWLQYTSRSIASIAHSIVQQLPKEYEARIDFDRFLSSFSFEVETPPDADVPKENRQKKLPRTTQSGRYNEGIESFAKGSVMDTPSAWAH